MTLGAEQLAYQARALAQTHPLTPRAKQYLDQAVAEQRTSQPIPEIGIWAGSAMLHGYCLRRVEEVDAGLKLEADPDAVVDHDKLDDEATRIAADLRTEDGNEHRLGDDQRTVDALDRLVFSEVQRRLDHWRDSIDDKAWGELEEYITWWLVKGYALRVAETTLGALR